MELKSSAWQEERVLTRSATSREVSPSGLEDSHGWALAKVLLRVKELVSLTWIVCRPSMTRQSKGRKDQNGISSAHIARKS